MVFMGGHVSRPCPPCGLRLWGLLLCRPHAHLPTDQLAYSCFSHLMKRMSQNFPNGGAMDAHFANMRSLIQVRLAAARGQVTGQRWACSSIHRETGESSQNVFYVCVVSFINAPTHTIFSLTNRGVSACERLCS